MPGFDVGMPDRAQIDGVELAQLVDRAVRQDFAGPQVAIAAEVEMSTVSYENSSMAATASSTLSPSAATSGPGAVAPHHRDPQSLVRVQLPASTSKRVNHRRGTKIAETSNRPRRRTRKKGRF